MLRRVAIGCIGLALVIPGTPAEARFRALIEWLRASPATEFRAPPPKPPRGNAGKVGEEARPAVDPGSGGLPPRGSERPSGRTAGPLQPDPLLQVEEAARAAAERSRGLQQAARAELRVEAREFWRARRPAGAEVPAKGGGSRVRIEVEAEGLTRSELEQMLDALKTAMFEPARPAREGLRLAKVDLATARVELVDSARRRSYVIGFKPLKWGFEFALSVVVADQVGVLQWAAQALPCDTSEGERSDNGGFKACDFLALTAGIIETLRAQWSGDSAPREVVL